MHPIHIGPCSLALPVFSFKERFDVVVAFNLYHYPGEINSARLKTVNFADSGLGMNF